MCEVWKEALPAAPTSWDDGIDGELLCHLLFGVRDHETRLGEGNKWEANLAFRCAPPRFSVQAGVRIRGKDCCHNTGRAHFDHILAVADLVK